MKRRVNRDVEIARNLAKPDLLAKERYRFVIGYDKQSVVTLEELT